MFDQNPSTLQTVTLTVQDLPSDIAEEVREVETRDPELLRVMMLYGVTHRAIFETLLDNSWGIAR